MTNPFDITFGKEPNSIISRSEELKPIINSFTSYPSNSNVYILTGIRGSGKTVAMTTISDYFKKEDNWLCIELNPESDMLEQLAAKLYGEGNSKKLFVKKEFNISFKGLSFSISGERPISSISSLLKFELSYLKEKNIKVLISIDEAVSNEYMKVFAHEFQTLLRDKQDLYLIMTGLYQNISLLEKNKSLTFLYRAPKIYLQSLNIISISNSYKNIFNLSYEDSIKLAKFTNGYAFAYQLLGNLLYESNDKVLNEDLISRYDELLYERSYNIIYNELTKKEKEILKVSVTDSSNRYIMTNVSISKEQLSAYKKNLVLKGILVKNKDSIEFALPRFKEFLKFIITYENIEI